jgi:hypothetical protein
VSKFLHVVIMAALTLAVVWAGCIAGGAFFESRYSHVAAHEKACRDARVAFFEDCFKTTTRPYCEMMWAEKHGHVFDSDPVNAWADEIDCSTEVK